MSMVRSSLILGITILISVGIIMLFIQHKDRYTMIQNGNGVFILDHKSSSLNFCDSKGCKLISVGADHYSEAMQATQGKNFFQQTFGCMPSTPYLPTLPQNYGTSPMQPSVGFITLPPPSVPAPQQQAATIAPHPAPTLQAPVVTPPEEEPQVKDEAADAPNDNANIGESDDEGAPE